VAKIVYFVGFEVLVAGDCEEYCPLGVLPCSLVEVHQHLGGFYSFYRVEEYVEQETNKRV
jgi:hypothetical protein